MDNNTPFALPLGSYKFKVLEAEKQTSKKGNPMIVCELELIDNPLVNTKGGQRDPNGLTIRHWVTLAPKGIGLTNDFRRTIGLAEITEDDLPNEESGFYVGQTGYAVFAGKAEEMKNQETGELVINPHTQKPELTYKRELVRLQPPPKA